MATDTWSGASSRRIKPVRARYSTLFRRRVGTAGARSTAQKFQTVHDTSRIAVEGAFLYGLLSRPRRTHSGDDWLDSGHLVHLLSDSLSGSHSYLHILSEGDAAVLSLL